MRRALLTAALFAALALAAAPVAALFQPGFVGAPTSPVTFAGGPYQVSARTFIPVTDAGGAAGELMVVAAWGFYSIGPVTSTTPAGWTLINKQSVDNGGGGFAGGLYYRVLDGSETSAVGFVDTGAANFRLQAIRFAGGHGSVSAQTAAGGSAINSCDSGTASTAGLSAPAIILGFAGRRGASPNATITPAPDASYTYGGTDNAAISYTIENAASVDTRVQVNDSGNRSTLCIAAGLQY